MKKTLTQSLKDALRQSPKGYFIEMMRFAPVAPRGLIDSWRDRFSRLTAVSRLLALPLLAIPLSALDYDPVDFVDPAIVTGQKMELQPKLAIVHGAPDRPLLVELPELPDLGFEGGEIDRRSGGESTGDAGNPEPVTTRVRSQLLNMIEEEEQTLFRFTDSVEVEATNLHATCDQMDVIAQKRDASEGTTGGRAMNVERIEARGSLAIKQEGRSASADRGTILPKEGKLVLEQNAVVKDSRGEVNGYRLTLLQGQRRALIEGGGWGGAGG